MTGRIASFVLATSLLLGLCATGARAEDFAGEVDALYGAVAGAVQDEAKLDALYDRAKALEKEMRDYKRANRKTLDDAAKGKLEALDDDVDALKGAIRVVGQLGNTADTSLERFDRALARLGLEAEEIHAVEPGVAVIQVDVGSYRSVLLRNGTKRNFSIGYGWQTPGMERVQAGVGSVRCERVTVLASLLNSRKHDLDGLAFTEFRVTDMGAVSKSLKPCD